MNLFILLACSGTNDNAYSLPDTVAVQQKLNDKSKNTQSDNASTEGGVELSTEMEGPSVTFEGQVEYKGSQTGTLIVEVLQNSMDQSVRLLANVTLSEFGDFKIDVPIRPNELTVMAYLDLTGNRISDDDPRGYLQVQNSLEAQTGFVVTILDLEELEKVKAEDDKAQGKSKE